MNIMVKEFVHFMKSLKIPEAMQLIYRKNDIFIPINNITQEDCDNFINNYNNRNLY